MLPGIDLRLQNVIKALQEVVLPAIPQDQRLARDQAMLAIGHLGLFASQWRYAARFEHGSLMNMVALGRAFLDEPGLNIDEPLVRALSDTVNRAVAADPSNLTDLELCVVVLGEALDAVIMSAGRPGVMPPMLTSAVLKYGQLQAHRERVWFAGTGLDPDGSELEDIGAMLTQSPVSSCGTA